MRSALTRAAIALALALPPTMHSTAKTRAASELRTITSLTEA
jgi:hypothetical protein